MTTEPDITAEEYDPQTALNWLDHMARYSEAEGRKVDASLCRQHRDGLAAEIRRLTAENEQLLTALAEFCHSGWSWDGKHWKSGEVTVSDVAFKASRRADDKIAGKENPCP